MKANEKKEEEANEKKEEEVNKEEKDATSLILGTRFGKQYHFTSSALSLVNLSLITGLVII
jgi:hypothetical protein